MVIVPALLRPAARVDRPEVGAFAMLAGALVIPAAVGVLATRLVDPEKRARGAAGFITTVLREYPYTVGMALTLLVMIAFAPVRKVRDLARRWTTHHVPVIVEPADYPAVVDDVQAALRRIWLSVQGGAGKDALVLFRQRLQIEARGAAADRGPGRQHGDRDDDRRG